MKLSEILLETDEEGGPRVALESALAKALEDKLDKLMEGRVQFIDWLRSDGSTKGVECEYSLVMQNIEDKFKEIFNEQ